MELFDPTKGGTPKLNQPVLYNSGGSVYLDTWKGNLPHGHKLVSQEQGKQIIQQNIDEQGQKVNNLIKGGQQPDSVNIKAVKQGIVANTTRLNEISNLTGAYDPSKIGGFTYVIGPNGQLMTEENAKNYVSPEDAKKQLPKAPSGTLLGATVGSIAPPTTQLKRGDTGAEVKKLQDYLVANGYMTQAQVDTGYGTYGPQTEKAVTAMQNALGVDNATGPGIYGPRTIAATTAAPAGGGGGATNADLDAILTNPNLTADMKAAIQAIYNAVESNDADTAARIQSAMKAASEFSDPYFKAQIRLATDSLQRGLTGKEGDLAFAESQKKAALEELRTSTSASKDLLSFEHQQELKNLATKYETDIETTQQNLAATGFTSSSRRARAESILAEQNQGLVESSNKTYGYQTGNLDRTLASNITSTVAEIENLRRLNEEGKLDLLRQTEEKVGSSTLGGLGYGNLLGGVGGDIERQKALDQFQFASNFVF